MPFKSFPSQSEAFAPVGTVEDGFGPPAVVQVPEDGLADASLEGFLRLPAELALYLARVDGVATVVAWAIGDKGNLFFVLHAVFPGAEFVEETAKRADDVDICPLAVSPNVIGLTRTPLSKNSQQSAAVVLNVEPVSDVHTVSVYRKGLPFHRTVENERHKFFWELARPIVVGAVGGDDGQTVGVIIGSHKVVRRSLGRRVGRVGGVRGLLCKEAFGP